MITTVVSWIALAILTVEFDAVGGKLKHCDGKVIIASVVRKGNLYRFCAYVTDALHVGGQINDAIWEHGLGYC